MVYVGICCVRRYDLRDHYFTLWLILLKVTWRDICYRGGSGEVSRDDLRQNPDAGMEREAVVQPPTVLPGLWVMPPMRPDGQVQGRSAE
ncbi:hypothetical protein D1820_02415 [Phaeobacter sp. LSS9]|nr:hypothetical protein D1820_02415 [Phaeobacter sp. LSS9]